jgi:hypothetical protein
MKLRTEVDAFRLALTLRQIKSARAGPAPLIRGGLHFSERWRANASARAGTPGQRAGWAPRPRSGDSRRQVRGGVAPFGHRPVVVAPRIPAPFDPRCLGIGRVAGGPAVGPAALEKPSHVGNALRIAARWRIFRPVHAAFSNSELDTMGNWRSWTAAHAGLSAGALDRRFHRRAGPPRRLYGGHRTPERADGQLHEAPIPHITLAHACATPQGRIKFRTEVDA